jgi:hypothetical protein
MMSIAFVKQLFRPSCWRRRRQLSPYLDGELDQAAAARMATHLAGCDACRAESEALSFAARLVANLPTPETESAKPWRTPEGEARLSQRPRKLVSFLAPSAAALAIATAMAWYFLRAPQASWEVARLTGRPVIGAIPIARTARLRAGEWLETDAYSRALIQVGALGQIEVDPRSRVRLIKSGVDEHRLELARGRIYASIVAPPRLFQVETPSAVAIDLGCAYTLDVDEAGGSLLRVTSGWVALARAGRESFVPAGALCRAEPDGRLGAPYFEDASNGFRQALSRFDFTSDKTQAFGSLLAEARARDALTLWHLLARVEGAERERVYERLAALVPSAKEFSKADALRLDPATLARWKEAVEFAAVGVDPRKVPVAAGALKPVGPMLVTRQSHTATLLPDGKVLIAGGGDRNVSFAGAELYDPATGGFSETGPMTTARAAHEAVLLPNGKVLITGGMGQDHDTIASAELYDPATRRFTPTGGMQIARHAHRATLLKNGKVLITGGLSPSWPQQRLAEIYDPETERFSPAGEMAVPRGDHTATLLRNGQVLLGAGSTGRSINEAVTDTAELFDPATNRFTTTGKLAAPRHKHAAVALRDGKVLVIGGAESRLRGFYTSAELYDPATGRFSATGGMSLARYKFRDAAALLTDGKVLVAGGGTRLEIYDPSTGVFSLLPDRVTTALRYSTTTLLMDGAALIAGGYSEEGLPSAGAWLYVPRR